MSVAGYIATIEASRNTIRNKLVELGLAESSAKLDKLAEAIEGIINQGAVNITVQEGDTYTIPAGFHNGNGTVSGVSGGGNYTLQAKTATPTKKQQNIAPDNGFYGLSGVTVAAIPEAYQDVSSVTSEAEHVLTGKIFVTATGVVTPGEMINNGAVSEKLDVSVVTYTIPKGFHSGAGKVQIVLETKSVTPTKSSQDITPSAGKVLSKVTVAAIPDKYQDVSGVTAGADDVLEGKEIVTADGTPTPGAMSDNGAVEKTLDTATTAYTIPNGYHNGAGKVQLVTETKSATPTKSAQNITPTSGKVLSKVTVAAIPDKYQDVSPVNAKAANVLDGDIFVDSTGTPVEGTMPNKGAVSATIDGLTTTSYTVPAGYHNGTGKVSLTNDIENALAAI